MIRQVGARAVGDVEQIGEHRDVLALLAIAQQRGDGHAEKLAEQIEQRGLDAGDDVVDAQVDFVRLP